mmetsp:Transcript_26027/g.47183  ORF Transcript_26027/g.47183 Transcript_26027/m.47183 type:complete len:452 (+) Transcript_26027:193-1548(+)
MILLPSVHTFGHLERLISPHLRILFHHLIGQFHIGHPSKDRISSTTFLPPHGRRGQVNGRRRRIHIPALEHFHFTLLPLPLLQPLEAKRGLEHFRGRHSPHPPRGGRSTVSHAVGGVHHPAALAAIRIKLTGRRKRSPPIPRYRALKFPHAAAAAARSHPVILAGRGRRVRCAERTERMHIVRRGEDSSCHNAAGGGEALLLPRGGLLHDGTHLETAFLVAADEVGVGEDEDSAGVLLELTESPPVELAHEAHELALGAEVPRQHLLLQNNLVANNERVARWKPLQDTLAGNRDGSSLGGLVLDDVHELTGEGDFLDEIVPVVFGDWLRLFRPLGGSRGMGHLRVTLRCGIVPGELGRDQLGGKGFRRQGPRRFPSRGGRGARGGLGGVRTPFLRHLLEHRTPEIVDRLPTRRHQLVRLHESQSIITASRSGGILGRHPAAKQGRTDLDAT